MTDPGDDSFARAFGAALGARGMSLTALRRRLIDTGNPVAAATLSYWRSGERVPQGTASMAVVEEVERVLGVPTGTLVRAIPDRVRIGRVQDPVNPFTQEQVREALAETMDLLDAPALTDTRELTSLVVNDVAADGILRRRTASTMIQSVVPHVLHEMTYTLISEIDVVGVPEITVAGATIDRDHLHSSEHVWACVMRLDRPLTLGASTMLEITMVERGEQEHQPETGAFVVRPIRELVMWTRFHEDAVPDWIDELETFDDSGELNVRPLPPQRSVHQSRRDFGPGALGIRWGYHGRWEHPEVP